MKQFEIGKEYTARSICDHDCIFSEVVTSRTASTVTVEGFRNKRCKIHHDDAGNEYIEPARYSMAPIFRA